MYAISSGRCNNNRPPADPSGKIQAIGCGDITFTGTSFDLNNLVLAGVRSSVNILSEGAEQEGYPDIGFDIGVLSLIDKDGNSIFPHCKGYTLVKHPKCPYCNGD